VEKRARSGERGQHLENRTRRNENNEDEIEKKKLRTQKRSLSDLRLNESEEGAERFPEFSGARGREARG
jgi:hypothetical protein